MPLKWQHCGTLALKALQPVSTKTCGSIWKILGNTHKSFRFAALPYWKIKLGYQNFRLDNASPVQRNMLVLTNVVQYPIAKNRQNVTTKRKRQKTLFFTLTHIGAGLSLYLYRNRQLYVPPELSRGVKAKCNKPCACRGAIDDKSLGTTAIRRRSQKDGFQTLLTDHTKLLQ